MPSPQRKAVILTALQLECLAVIEHIDQRHQVRHPKGTVYECGTFGEGLHAWDILVAEAGAGTEAAAAEAERAIRFFEPTIAMFVGVAGGLKDVSAGDVVASTKIYNYGYGKAHEEFQVRPTVEWTSYTLEQLAKAIARNGDWRARITHKTQLLRQPQVFTQPIAAGPAVVASAQAELFKFIRRHYGDAVAVEMEGHGHLLAVRMNAPLEGIVIRGISDLVEGKNASDDVRWQPIAADHAAAFAFEILAKHDLPTGTPARIASSQTMAEFQLPPDSDLHEGSQPEPTGTSLRLKDAQTRSDKVTDLLGLKPTGSAGPLGTPATIHLVVKEAERLVLLLRQHQDLLEADAAFETLSLIQRWVPEHEEHLSPELMADMYLAVADSLVWRARTNAVDGQKPDFSEAIRYLDKAHHAVER